MTVGSIAGGTRAGWRKVRPAHQPWECDCDAVDPGWKERGVPRLPKMNPGWRGKCDDCGQTRPT
jgi:hypothetical protein